MTARTRTPKEPPHSLDAERAVLGSLLLDPAMLDRVLAEFHGRDLDGIFFNEQHGEIWRAMRSLAASGRPIDAVCLIAEIQSRPDCEISAPYLAQLANATPTSANAAHYARQVRDFHDLRRLRDLAGQAHRAAGHSNADPARVLLDLSTGLAQLGGSNASKIVPLADDLEAAVNAIVQTHTGEATGGIATGFRGLDGILGGFAPGALYIVGARPSIGKSALALNLALNAAHRDCAVLLFSLEMPRASLAKRLVLAAGEISAQRLKARAYRDDDLRERLTQAQMRLAAQPIHVAESARLPVYELAARARDFQRRQPLGVIIVDYLQLLQSSNPKAHREQQVAEISREIKVLAGELGVPIVLLAQLNREADKDPAAPPRLSHLRESGAVEQDADAVLLLSPITQPAPDRAVVRVHVAKHREGECGECALLFDKAIQKFNDGNGPIPDTRTSPTRVFKRNVPATASNAPYNEDDEAF